MTKKKTGVDWVMQAASELESDNHHLLTNIPEQLFDELCTLVPLKLHTELGKIIYENLHNL